MKTAFVLLFVACILALTLGYKSVAFIEDVRAITSERIIQGTPAINGLFPYQAFLLSSSSGGQSAGCGASLISTTWLMTAAHCIQGRVTSRVHLGNVAYASSPVIVSTNHLIVHPNYNSNNLNHDIGLIRMNSPVTLTTYIQTVPYARDPSVTFAGVNAIVSGFGYTANTGSVSPTLNYVGVKIITNAECASVYGSNTVISSVICCLGGTNSAQGICFGDSGGPLVTNINGVRTQIGVVSFVSSKGCTSSDPNGFYRPSHYTSWINSHTGL